MSPPDLTGNAPIADIIEPMEIYLVKTFGNEFGFSVLYGVNSRLCKRLHLNEPLCGNFWLDSRSAAIASTDIMAVFLDFYQCALSFEIFYDSLSCFVSVHACVLRIIVNYRCVVVHYVDHGQIMAQSDFKVVRVVSRSYLNNARTEIHFNIIVGNDRNLTVNDRQYNSFADKIFIAFIGRIYRDSRIAEKSFGTCCCEFKITVAVLYFVAKMPEMSCLIFICYLRIGKRSFAFRTPVYDAFAAVNESFFIILYKYFLDRLGAAFVHGKALS